MKRIILAVVLGIMVGALASPVAAAPEPPKLDPVATWNELALESVRLARASDADAARAYGMLNAALYDAVNGIAAQRAKRARGHALTPPDGAPRHGDARAAAVTAAHQVLAHLYPDRAERFARQLEADLAKLDGGPPVTAGRTWGRRVGDQTVRLREGDGSRPVETQPPGSGPGQFPLAWSGTQYRSMKPFAATDPARYIAPGQPELSGLDYAAAFAEVKLLGNAAIPDAGKLAIFRYWSLPAGTAQPAGEWIRIALEIGGTRELALEPKSRLFGLLGMAAADVTIPTVATKFRHRHWRPQTAIQQADTDGNPHTEQDESWQARAGSPGSTPEYISGHSSFSAAAAAVIAGFFCNDQIAFGHVTDSAPIDPETGKPMRREYQRISAAAEEAGRSRVFGGQHFTFSNQAGLTMGRDLASEILARKLLYTSGPTHTGQCPR